MPKMDTRLKRWQCPRIVKPSLHTNQLCAEAKAEAHKSSSKHLLTNRGAWISHSLPFKAVQV